MECTIFLKLEFVILQFPWLKTSTSVYLKLDSACTKPLAKSSTIILFACKYMSINIVLTELFVQKKNIKLLIKEAADSVKGTLTVIKRSQQTKYYDICHRVNGVITWEMIGQKTATNLVPPWVWEVLLSYSASSYPYQRN